MTAVSDLIFAAASKADRLNAPLTTAEWVVYANEGAQELYGALVNSFEDYNLTQYPFTLAGGSTGNTLLVGPGTSVPDFMKPRKLSLQVGGSPTPFVTIPKLENLMLRDRFTYPLVVPIYGAIPSRWCLYGNVLEVLPPTVAGNSYVLWYIPRLQPFDATALDATIDKYWLTLNGWDRFITEHMAMQALLKEESLDSAQLHAQAKEREKQRIIDEAKPRDAGEPKAFLDMNRVKNPWSAWGTGVWGPGWGGEPGDGGMW